MFCPAALEYREQHEPCSECNQFLLRMKLADQPVASIEKCNGNFRVIFELRLKFYKRNFLFLIFLVFDRI